MLHNIQVAIRSLWRTPWMALLVVIAVGVGIGTSMTAYSLLAAMGRDPIPHKSAMLFAPRLDTHGGAIAQPPGSWGAGRLPSVMLSYRDAVALRDARLGTRQAVMYETAMLVRAEAAGSHARLRRVRATDSDFFGMFDVPLKHGSFWGPAADRDAARVVVVSERVARALFGTDEAVGRRVALADRGFEVIGVTREWWPRPRFYDLGIVADTASAYGGFDEIFVPLNTATSMLQSSPGVAYDCSGSRENQGRGPITREEWLNSECRWTQMWVELPTAQDVARYRSFLADYARQVEEGGRFAWLPDARLYDVRQWLAAYRVVPDEYRIATLLAFGFLAACLINAIGLLSANFRRRGTTLSLRRALGASRCDLFAQCLVEVALLGLLGAALGLMLVWLGIQLQKWWVGAELAGLSAAPAHLVALAVVLAVAGTLLAGLLPAWQASSGREVLRRDGRPAGLAGKLLVAVQVAVTLAVVSNGVFVAVHKHQLARRPSGADEASLMAIPVLWPREHADIRARIEQDLALLHSIPGVLGASAGGIPLVPTFFGGELKTREDGPAYPVGVIKQADELALDVWGMRITRGRWFRREEIGVSGGGASERPANVVVITQALSRRLFGDEDPLGRLLYFRGIDIPLTVVGEVERFLGMYSDDGETTVFLPGIAARNGMVTYALRVEPERQEEAGALVVAKLREADPDRGVGDVPLGILEGLPEAVPFRKLRDAFTRSDRSLAALLLATCALLLLVTALGVIGVTASRVIQRRNDIGIRRAIGARRWHILAQVQYENLLVVMAGVLPGVVGALLLNQWLAREYAMRLLDPRGLAGGAALVILLGQLASFWPALRASMVPPAAAARAN